MWGQGTKCDGAVLGSRYNCGSKVQNVMMRKSHRAPDHATRNLTLLELCLDCRGIVGNASLGSRWDGPRALCAVEHATCDPTWVAGVTYATPFWVQGTICDGARGMLHC